MKRKLIPAGPIVALVLAATALAGAGHPTTVKLASTSAGKLVTNGGGRTLYMFTKDARNKDRCMGISGCASTWPPLLTRANPIAAGGVNASLLGTITVSGGRHQVTYAGHPLYTYSGDTGPRQTSYVGAAQFGGRWYGVGLAGGAVK